MTAKDTFLSVIKSHCPHGDQAFTVIEDSILLKDRNGAEYPTLTDKVCLRVYSDGRLFMKQEVIGDKRPINEMMELAYLQMLLSATLAGLYYNRESAARIVQRPGGSVIVVNITDEEPAAYGQSS